MIGTHTHVQTNDARVLAGGTAALTDAGMTGPHDSVIGVRAELAIERMRSGMPVRFHPADGDVRIEGALVECGPRRPRYSLRDGAGARAIAATATAASATSATFRATSSHTGPGSARDEIPVAGREPELGQHERERQQRRRGEPSPSGDERYERDEPDEELRRDHLAERDERRTARPPSLRRAPPSSRGAWRREPRRRRRRRPAARSEWCRERPEAPR